MFLKFDFSIELILGLVYIIPFVFFEYQMRFDERLLFRFNRFYRYTIYLVFTLLIIFWFYGSKSEFIYFQF